VAGLRRSTVQRIFDWFWQLPQNQLGVLASIGGTKSIDPVSGAIIVENSWVAQKLRTNIALGEFILSPDERIDEDVLYHERAHVTYSRMSGGSYLIQQLIGYDMGVRLACITKGFKGLTMEDAHDASPFEIAADIGSGRKRNVDRNRFIQRVREIIR
jgi:hypothetical protein